MAYFSLTFDFEQCLFAKLSADILPIAIYMSEWSELSLETEFEAFEN